MKGGTRGTWCLRVGKEDTDLRNPLPPRKPPAVVARLQDAAVATVVLTHPAAALPLQLGYLKLIAIFFFLNITLALPDRQIWADKADKKIKFLQWRNVKYVNFINFIIHDCFNKLSVYSCFHQCQNICCCFLN